MSTHSLTLSKEGATVMATEHALIERTGLYTSICSVTFDCARNLGNFEPKHVLKHRDSFGKEKKKFYILVIQYPKYF